MYELFYKGDEGDRSVDELIGAMCIEEESGYEQSQWINGESVVTVLKGARPEELQQVELEPGPSIEFTDVQELGWYKPSPDSDMAIIVYTQVPDAVASIRGEIIGYGTPPEISYVLDNKGNAILVLDTNSRNLIIPDLETVEVFNCNAREFTHRLYKSQVYAHTYLRQLFPSVAPDVPDPNTMHLSDYCSWYERFDIVVDDEKLALNPGLKQVRIGDRKSRVFREALKMLESNMFTVKRVIDGDRIITEHETTHEGYVVDYQ
ncbi:hypothetical protein SPFM5_00284 [Salmonella phage SPFM5]|nr:hypothetical protein SPFM5_00284 [Salmonella phage SPFM5]